MNDPLHLLIMMDSAESNSSACGFKLCHGECRCGQLQRDFLPFDYSQVLFRGVIANNPNNPGFNLKEGVVSYSQIESIPLAEISKLKLCYRNDYMLINTLQIYSSNHEAKPVCIGVDQKQAALWFLSIIEAKLAVQNKIKVVDDRRDVEDQLTGVLYKKGTFGGWKKHQAICAASPAKSLKLCDEYTGINSTPEIWTRFEVITQQQVPCLVVKLWGALGKKQLAVPLPQLVPWLIAICGLLS